MDIDFGNIGKDIIFTDSVRHIWQTLKNNLEFQ